MKITIDISQIVYETGVSRYTKELVRNLSKIDQRNKYQLFGGSWRQKAKLKSFANSLPGTNTSSKIIPIPPTILEMIFNRLRFISVDNLIGKTDLFHSSDWTQPRITAKKITTIHDLAVLKFPKLFHPKIVEVQKRRLELVKKECDLIIAVSHNTKNDIIELLHIPESKIVVIYEAASNVFKPIEQPIVNNVKHRYQIGGDFILTVITFGARKNLKTLYTAFEKLSDKNITLVIVGDYSLPPTKKVKITGFITDNDLAALYSSAKVFVYPSVYEGFGLPVVEAMSCKTPVICSDRSSLKEVGGDAAIYIDPDDPKSIATAIADILSMTDVDYQKLKDKSLAQSIKFSWEKCAQETLAAYKMLKGDN